MVRTRALLEDYVHGKVDIDQKADFDVALDAARDMFGTAAVRDLLRYVSGYPVANETRASEIVAFLTQFLRIPGISLRNCPFKKKQTREYIGKVLRKYESMWFDNA